MVLAHASLLTALQAATIGGNKKELNRLIAEIGESNGAKPNGEHHTETEAARMLQRMADRYDYDGLIALLTGAASE